MLAPVLLLLIVRVPLPLLLALLINDMVLFADGLPVFGVAGAEFAPFWFSPGIASIGRLQ